MRLKWGKVLGVLLTLTLLSACGGLRGEQVEVGFAADDPAPYEVRWVDESAANGGPAAGQVIPPTPIVVGDNIEAAARALTFSATELYSGGQVAGADLLSGGVIVTFVEPSCQISADQGPTISRAADQHPEITYVIVHSGAEETAYLDFVEKTGLTHENIVHLRDDAGALSDRFGIEGYPSTLLIDTEGRPSVAFGALSEEGLTKAREVVVGSAEL